MVQPLMVDGRKTWLKRYDASPISRRLRASVWNALTRQLDTAALGSPPRHAGEQAKALELRRITELRHAGVRVPEVLGEGRTALLLGDLGPSLAHCLKRAGNDAEVDQMVKAAAGTLASVHGRGAYLGQAFARNIAISDGRVGFLDFEEDPLEVMSLRDAQARDWMLFSAGVSRHYDGRGEVLAQILNDQWPRVDNAVHAEVCRLAGRLGFLQRATRHLGARARELGVAVAALRRHFGWTLVLGLMFDYCGDADLDVLNLITNLLS